MSDPATGADAVSLAAAGDVLAELAAPVDGTERMPIGSADGRVLAEPTEALRDVPGFRRAATDGYAVRAADTEGASERSPAVLRAGSGATPGTAVRVDAGQPLPDGADAIVRTGRAEVSGDEVEVLGAVTEGENVTPAGGDLETGERIHEPGHRLRPSDLGLLRSTGYGEVPVRVAPSIGVVPTGDELVRADPGDGEVLETNGLTVAQYVERWGGRATYRDAIGDDPEFLRVALQRDLTKDVVVTIGGSADGESDLVPEIVEERGEVLVRGVAMRPGGSAAIGRVQGIPVVALPGPPVACIVAAVQILRPAVRRAAGLGPGDHPRVRARLEDGVASGPGVRTFAPVTLERRDDERVAVPVGSGSADRLSSVALADGWIEVEESRTGMPAGETVGVQDWERSP